MTLIVLLILAGVSLSGLFSKKGLFKRTENASNRYNEAKAREVLETVLLADGQYEKNTNPEYNQDEFLDALIKSEIPGSNVKGDVAIIGEYAYELDRSVPKIGHNGYLGKEKDLIFPAVIVAEITQADTSDNYRTAKIEITATINQKAENGINRIEIWQNGIKQTTITCNNEKTVTTEYRANRNGIYTIKAYSKISNTEMHNAEISGSARTTVEGIVPAVEFYPNGNTIYQKSHTTTVKVKETAETVTEMKYLWRKTDESEPQASEFKENCANNSIVTGQGENMTGEYYLWILLTTENNKINICGSNAFYFDNEAPTVDLISTPVSETSFTLTATASDKHSKIARYEFYVDGEKKEPTTIEDGKATYTWNGTSMLENTACSLAVIDTANNIATAEGECRTKLHMWDTYEAKKQPNIEETFVGRTELKPYNGINTDYKFLNWYNKPELTYKDGKVCAVTNGDFSGGYVTNCWCSPSGPTNCSTLYKVIEHFSYDGDRFMNVWETYTYKFTGYTYSDEPTGEVTGHLVGTSTEGKGMNSTIDGVYYKYLGIRINKKKI